MDTTALNWLRQELEYLREFEEFYSKRYQEFDELFNKAKQMEKEQIIRTHLMARCYDTKNSVTEAEQYYNETFKSE